MAVITAAELVDFVVNARKEGWGYVFGAQGQLYTRKLAEQWGKIRRSGRSYDYFVRQCARWFDRTVVDCSGLIIEAYRSRNEKYGDKTANTLFGKVVKTGRLSTIPELPGVCVWRKGHIGVYVGAGKVIEAGGTNIGVVVSALKSPATGKPWTNWGKLADVDYTDIPDTPEEPDTPSCWLGRELKLTFPYMRGEDVRQVQEALTEKGFFPGKADGVYGPKTQKAVISFQKNAEIEVDGIVGEETVKALFGAWVTDCKGNPCCPSEEAQLSSFSLSRILKVTTPYMWGDDVRDVQDALLLNGFSPGEPDGIYGPRTKKAVTGFQKKNGLNVDGMVGADTAAALGGIWVQA